MHQESSRKQGLSLGVMIAVNSDLQAPAPEDESLHLLDDAQEWQSFSQPVGRSGDCWESSVLIEGMHCAACALSVEDALHAVPGVLRAEVSAASRRARVQWSSLAAKPSDWMKAVRNAGYRAVPALDTQARARRLAESRQALWRLGVAGLCMMQVMMYAYPAYAAAPGDLSPEMERLLRWASWVLTLPVLLFSCGPFFSSALRDSVQRRVSMDLPVALGMAITFAVSTAGTFDPTGIFGREVYFDSFTMFVFFLLAGRWLELRLRDRTAGALEALMNRLPDRVARRSVQGAWEAVPLRRLRPGDEIRVLAGETFAADGLVLRGRTLVDEALLTGESSPLLRDPGGQVIAGSHNLSGTVEVRVQRIGRDTRFASIVALMEAASVSKPSLARLADRVARPFLLAVLLSAVGAAAYGWERDAGHALMVAVAVLVVTCPCALSLATPAAMLAAAGALARQGTLVRRLGALEALAEVDTVFFDKTGTLTRDALTLTGVQQRAGADRLQVLAMAAALARHSLHPASRALVAAQQQAGAGDWRVEEACETLGAGLTGRLGQPGTADQGGALRLGSAEFCGLPVPVPVPQDLAVYLTDARGWLATFSLAEDVRPDAQAAVRALVRAGLEVRLLSGDQARAVARVAHQLGLAQFQGGCSAADKLAALRQAQGEGRRVAVVGDGLNDGPVLAGAHVSFAFGQAVPLAQAQADFVVLGERLATVPQTLLLARRTLRVVRQNLAWAAAYNAVCVPLAVLGWLPAWLAGLGMGLSSLLVVLNALRLARPLAPSVCA